MVLLWYWAWIDYDDDHGLPWYMAALCIAYGLAVRFPGDRERRPSLLRNEAPASA